MEGMLEAWVRRRYHVLDAKNWQGDRLHQVFVMVALTALVCVLALAWKLACAGESPHLVVPTARPIAQMLDAGVFDWGRMLILYIQNSRWCAFTQPGYSVISSFAVYVQTSSTAYRKLKDLTSTTECLYDQ